MSNKKNNQAKKHKTYTPWHVMLSDFLKYVINKDDMEVKSFVKLGALPLESDLIIIRKKTAKYLKGLYSECEFMIPWLGRYTVVEYKSPSDTLEFEDFDIARAYSLLAKIKYKLDSDKDMHLIFMASSFQKGYKEHIENNGYEYAEIEEGIYGDLEKKCFWINLKQIGEKYPGNVINLFSSRYKQYVSGSKALFFKNRQILYYLFQSIRRNKENFMNNLAFRQGAEFVKSMEIMQREFIESLDIEDRLRGIKPEDRLRGIKPEDRLKGIKPEERLRGIKPEDRLKGIKPEDRLKGIKPEDRLKGIKPEDILSTLKPEEIDRFIKILPKYKSRWE
jgi:hypothetical protein